VCGGRYHQPSVEGRKRGGGLCQRSFKRQIAYQCLPERVREKEHSPSSKLQENTGGGVSKLPIFISFLFSFLFSFLHFWRENGRIETKMSAKMKTKMVNFERH
jgi:hypothetical protein